MMDDSPLDPANPAGLPSRNELFALFGAASDGTISEAEHARLQDSLRGSSDARRLWFLYNDVDAGLQAFAQASAQRSSMATLRPPPPPPLRRPSWPARLIGLAALIAAAALGIWTLNSRSTAKRNANVSKKQPDAEKSPLTRSGLPQPPATQPAPANEATSRAVAVLKSAVDVEWPAPADARPVGAVIEPGWLKIKTGLVKLEFFSGASVLIEGPAELNLISSREAFCQVGKLTAVVPPPAHGFQIESPRASFTAESGEFGVDITRQTAELHVFKGELSVSSNAPIRRLSQGRAVMMDDAAASHMLAANRTKFVSMEEMDTRSEQSLQRMRAEWLNRGKQLNADPALLLRFDFESTDLKNRILHNVARGPARIGDGAIVGCDWSEGRWPGKGALEFRSLSDHMRVSVPGSRKSITLAAWVCVFGLDRPFNSLCMSDGWKDGSVHWQIMNDGHVRFSVKTPGKIYDIDSPIVFTPERIGKWVHVAVTFDGDRRDVRHYFDGELVRRVPVAAGIGLKIDSAEIGNWNVGGTDDKSPIRHFSGRLDEFMLFERVLSADEIQLQARWGAEAKK